MQRIVIVGNGMVGHRLIEELHQHTPSLSITVLSEEARVAYDRVQLSHYFDEPRPDLSLTSHGEYSGRGVDWIPERALSLDPSARTVTTANRTLPYDTLILATGSVPFVPPLPNLEQRGSRTPGWFVYRTLADLDAIKAYAAGVSSGTVIGGGLLGLEAAAALQKLGLKVNVVEFAPRLMPAQIDDAGGALLRGFIEEMGIGVLTGAATQELLLDGAGRLRGLRFADGSKLETGLLVFSAGIRPRDDLARAAGLAVGERGGIHIDDQCRTSDPAIYAVGECALHAGRIYGLVSPGYSMARVAAASIAGAGDTLFTGADVSTKLKLLGVEVGSFGDAFARSEGARELSIQDNVARTYSKLVLSADGTRVLGGVLVGDTSQFGELSALAKSGERLRVPAASLLLPPAAATDAPGNPAVCSCEGVRRGTLLEAVAGGAHDIAALKSCTRAGTGCGGCLPLVKDALNEGLSLLGRAVDHSLCEHFRFTRQELFDLIRIRGHRSWESVLDAHGSGHGCEVCKPTVASILATQHNDYILKDELAPLQDTNDAYLANIQKNGTYSVMPRVPGGEITPEKLMVLGRVAQTFGLYCKITGGQRIDLLGARLDQLPDIWRELVAAGFESGHAYGKSLRTVKSCVGSTWCRYGVQDSTTLAIDLELRYRGLRSPHKLKAGVSGCTRECAEAQSKDFGLIATERGWNLYVGGNGGVTPRHAQLLAQDLDAQTVTRYLDRFLMYYVRTADRLQRTSTWLDKMEGGIEHLRAVVIEDSLGLADELEAAMRFHIATYACEWQATLADTSKVSRFRHFVNSDETDGAIQWVTEREQPRPAFEHELTLLPLFAND
ncbi:nitrite reductase large subunit NirB [Deinococcus ruber]|uniref:Nitrite reductase large subunit n=1 Tax=Deinococcus ruber TaxID=1848197 RepID=A0A918CDW0_9DEIO|nr:nitrite reductase large subunit NirB [Deinococcus ruber]GGR19253.1 nitrite reductase large subunit [Deinococcus ruber]